MNQTLLRFSSAFNSLSSFFASPPSTKTFGFSLKLCSFTKSLGNVVFSSGPSLGQVSQSAFKRFLTNGFIINGVLKKPTEREVKEDGAHWIFEGNLYENFHSDTLGSTLVCRNGCLIGIHNNKYLNCSATPRAGCIYSEACMLVISCNLFESCSTPGTIDNEGGHAFYLYLSLSKVSDIILYKSAPDGNCGDSTMILNEGHTRMTRENVTDSYGSTMGCTIAGFFQVSFDSSCSFFQSIGCNGWGSFYETVLDTSKVHEVTDFNLVNNTFTTCLFHSSSRVDFKRGFFFNNSTPITIRGQAVPIDCIGDFALNNGIVKAEMTQTVKIAFAYDCEVLHSLEFTKSKLENPFFLIFHSAFVQTWI